MRVPQQLDELLAADQGRKLAASEYTLVGKPGDARWCSADPAGAHPLSLITMADNRPFPAELMPTWSRAIPVCCAPRKRKVNGFGFSPGKIILARDGVVVDGVRLRPTA
jgi:hypothetical protein